jgi:hypothetical protein
LKLQLAVTIKHPGCRQDRFLQVFHGSAPVSRGGPEAPWTPLSGTRAVSALTTESISGDPKAFSGKLYIRADATLIVIRVPSRR